MRLGVQDSIKDDDLTLIDVCARRIHQRLCLWRRAQHLMHARQRVECDDDRAQPRNEGGEEDDAAISGR